jgi:hypothetical protein
MNNAPIKLSISLQNMPHPVRRKLLLPEDIDMRQLHHIIQDAFGWENAHLFQFCEKQSRSELALASPEDVEMAGMMGGRVKAAHEYKLTEFIEEIDQNHFLYWYDFGDDWWHKITIGKLSKKDLERFDGTPLCTSAKGTCPPEDIGGPWGYADFLANINDPKSDEGAELREWMGIGPDEKYNTDDASPEVINAMMRALVASGVWTDNDSYQAF